MAIVQIRIVGMDEASARQAILHNVDIKRAKPSNRPSFPGGPSSTTISPAQRRRSQGPPSPCCLASMLG